MHMPSRNERTTIARPEVSKLLVLKRRLLLLGLACTGGVGLWGCGGGHAESPAEAAQVLPVGSGHDEALASTSQLGPASADGEPRGAEAIDLGQSGFESPSADVQTKKILASQTPSITTSSSAVTLSPTLTRLELVANDGISEVQPLPNHWGQHQTRVTVHRDGTVRVLYLALGGGGSLNWRLMRRSPASGIWTLEATGNSVDDVQLVRNPVNDAVHVVAWPNSVATVYTSPTYLPERVPGRWQTLSAASRHYSSTGIGSDGSMCLKTSVELASAIPTISTILQTTCGRFDAGLRKWTWSPQMSQIAGLRRAYDYLFPGGYGQANQLVGTAQVDVHKAALGLAFLRSTQGDYVFNGVSSYTMNTDTGLAWDLRNLVQPLTVPASVSQLPVVKQIDAYIDRSKRLFSIFYSTDPMARTPDGIYMKVTDSRNVQLFASRLTALPAYGFARVFDDAQGRLWLLWSNLGTQMSHVVLYRVQMSAGAITLSNPTDLSSKFVPYAIQGSPLLALPRGGQLVDNSVDGLLITCDGFFMRNILSSCYPSGVNRQKIVSFRIQLPN